MTDPGILLAQVRAWRRRAAGPAALLALWLMLGLPAPGQAQPVSASGDFAGLVEVGSDFHIAGAPGDGGRSAGRSKQRQHRDQDRRDDPGELGMQALALMAPRGPPHPDQGCDIVRQGQAIA